ncbi:MAG TPA: Gfo/Idh/MocA family oxidoreductase [Methylomirabilota bacterium]|nr:Gfo/Idh/MocA family oxidoreductase [Methylomirabilota bacterium]
MLASEAMRTSSASWIFAVMSVICFNANSAFGAEVIRMGMIGLDTSHVPAFTKIFNDPKATGELAGFKVVAGYPGGTDIPPSRDRVKKFTADIQQMGVEIVDNIPALLTKVDVVLLMSVDGRIHLQEAEPVIAAGKPLFIDKPMAGSLRDGIKIAELAQAKEVPWFSSSSVRYYPGFQKLSKSDGLIGAQTWGACTYLEGTPDMFYYGIHGIEALYTLMGAGCESLTRTQTTDTDVVTGVWKDGRVGSYRGIRKGKAEFGGVAFMAKEIKPVEVGGGYEALCIEIAKFFRTGKAPIPPEETLEILAFMEAADESKRRGGAPVKLEEVMKIAREAR